MARTSSGGRVTARPADVSHHWRGRHGAAPKRAGGADANGGGEPLVVFFDDLRLVRDLLGDYDANLAVLEDRLGVRPWSTAMRSACADPSNHARPQNRCWNSFTAGSRKARRSASAKLSAPSATRLASRQTTRPDANLPEAQQISTRKRLITARTPGQSEYLASLESNDLVFATGPAGTGKTYLAVAFAAMCLESGKCDRTDPVAAGGRSRRAARLPSRRYAREGRPISAPSLRCALRRARA